MAGVGLEPFLSASEIQATVARLAGEIDRDYRGADVTLATALKGGAVFLADLMRQLTVDVGRVEYIRASSYGAGAESSGVVRIDATPPDGGAETSPLRGAQLVLVDDILDTGHTLAALLDWLRQQQPASLRSCVLLDKPSRRQTPVAADYVGFTIPDRFVVGYGMDYGERYRNLAGIYCLTLETVSAPASDP